MTNCSSVIFGFGQMKADMKLERQQILGFMCFQLKGLRLMGFQYNLLRFDDHCRVLSSNRSKSLVMSVIQSVSLFVRPSVRPSV